MVELKYFHDLLITPLTKILKVLTNGLESVAYKLKTTAPQLKSCSFSNRMKKSVVCLNAKAMQLKIVTI